MESKMNPMALGPTYSVVLYDLATGRIVHTHHQMTLREGPPPDKNAVQNDALREAARHHSKVSELGILHVPDCKTDAVHRVNVGSRTLEELDKTDKPALARRAS